MATAASSSTSTIRTPGPGIAASRRPVCPVHQRDVTRRARNMQPPARNSRHQDGVVNLLLPVRRSARAAEAADHRAYLLDRPLPPVRNRCIDGDSVHPGFGGRDRLPARPLPVRTLKSVVRTVFGRAPIAQHGGHRAEDLAVRGSIETLEIRFVSGPLRIRLK